MKHSLITILLLLYSCSLICQKRNPIQIDKAIINKWIRASVNIECRPRFSQQHNDLKRLYETKQIDKKTYEENRDKLNGVSYSGTAVFLQYNNSYYFLTARHVIADISSRDTNDICWKILLIENDTLLNNTSGVFVDSSENTFITAGAELTTLFDVMLSKYYYIFSSVSEDIGIIKIDAFTKDFYKSLMNRGLHPYNHKGYRFTFSR